MKMSQQNRTYSSTRFLQLLNQKRNNYGRHFQEHVQRLQEEAISNGLEEDEMISLVEIVMETNLYATKKAALIKCLIPVHNVNENLLKDIIEWCFSSIEDLPLTVVTCTCQWIIGVWEYQLAERKHINIYYDMYFYTLMKNMKLVPLLSRLIYILTKPEDVTRRQVIRLLRLQEQCIKYQKHINALLSLFKTFKPEFVPEKIPSVNIQSIWSPLHESLRIGLEAAKNRMIEIMNFQGDEHHFDWNIQNIRLKQKNDVLIPSVGYFNIGSRIFKEENTKNVFDFSNMGDLGKHQLNIELPCRATSLLANTAGYHLLTFADIDYQNRFVYNLYNTLQKAFFIESDRYSKEELNNLLAMTTEFCRYMQQGIPIVNHFVIEYLTARFGDISEQFLSLLRWSFTTISVFQDTFFKEIKKIFQESSLNMKCQILKTLKILLTNVYVSKGFNEKYKGKPSPLLGQNEIEDADNIIQSIIVFTEDLIISGFIIHSYHVIFFSEALSFYEQVLLLESHNKLLMWTVAPPAVIYGGLATRSCAILSRVCELLTRYREMSDLLQTSQKNTIYKKQVELLYQYFLDFANCLWNNKAFTSRNEKGTYFLKGIPNELIKEFGGSHNLDPLLGLSYHPAILPYLTMLYRSGIEMVGTNDTVKAANLYFPDVINFIFLINQYTKKV